MLINQMKHLSFILLAVLFITYCDNSQGNTNLLNTGDTIEYKVDTISFSLAHVAGKKFFPIGENDDDIAFVWNPFWIAETEVTYELWAAISEANPIVQDLPFIKAKAEGNIDIFNGTAKGFRLPTSGEWELAARYRGADMTNTVQSTIKGVDFSDPFDGIYWTRGTSLSGAPTVYDDVDEVNNTFGVFNSEMAAVKSKTSGFNALGLYDMSGNVREWCFDAYLNSIAFRMMSGGCYSSFCRRVAGRKIG